MSAIYLSCEANERLTVAQRVVDEHLVECGACAVDLPCFDRIEAERVFLSYGRLPRRTPGLAGTAVWRRPGFGWFVR